MIKDLFIKLENLIRGFKTQLPRKGISFTKAKSIGILVKNPRPECNYAIDNFVNELKNSGKKVEVIVYLDKEVNRLYTFNYIELRYSDIDLFGRFKDDRVNKFIKTEFDYLYSINISPFLPFENILLRNKGSLRIGLLGASKKGLLEISLTPGKNEKEDSLIKRMLEYTKKLQDNE